MTRPNYSIPENPVYLPVIPALMDSDPARATTVFNPLFLQIITNIHAVKIFADKLEKTVQDGIFIVDDNTGRKYRWGIDTKGVYLMEV